jgi:hypothetical protein
MTAYLANRNFKTKKSQIINNKNISHMKAPQIEKYGEIKDSISINEVKTSVKPQMIF